MHTRIQFIGELILLHNGAISLMMSHCNFTSFFKSPTPTDIFCLFSFFSQETLCLKSSEHPTIYKFESLKATFSISYYMSHI